MAARRPRCAPQRRPDNDSGRPSAPEFHRERAAFSRCAVRPRCDRTQRRPPLTLHRSGDTPERLRHAQYQGANAAQLTAHACGRSAARRTEECRRRFTRGRTVPPGCATGPASQRRRTGQSRRGARGNRAATAACLATTGWFVLRTIRRRGVPTANIVRCLYITTVTQDIAA